MELIAYKNDTDYVQQWVNGVLMSDGLCRCFVNMVLGGWIAGANQSRKGSKRLGCGKQFLRDQPEGNFEEE